jgi:hypothetical protein
MIVRTLAGSRSYIFLSCRQITQKEKVRGKGTQLIALPSDVADTHRPYNGLPVLVEFVWREKFHESALWRSSHEHSIREVVARHAQYDLHIKNSTSFSLYILGEWRQPGAGKVQQNLRLTVD